MDQDSAVMAVKGERAIPMHADHTEICRFAPSDGSYGEVLMLIKDVYKEANDSPCRSMMVSKATLSAETLL